MAKLEKINKTENKQNIFFFILKKKRKQLLSPNLSLHATTFRFPCFFLP